jgi:hypothetical protein
VQPVVLFTRVFILVVAAMMSAAPSTVISAGVMVVHVFPVLVMVKFPIWLKKSRTPEWASEKPSKKREPGEEGTRAIIPRVAPSSIAPSEQQAKHCKNRAQYEQTNKTHQEKR